ncbi:MAG: hypothetical protein V7750_09345 [Sneathiella sp.]
MTRIIVLILAMTLMSGSLVACGKKNMPEYKKAPEQSKTLKKS